MFSTSVETLISGLRGPFLRLPRRLEAVRRRILQQRDRQYRRDLGAFIAREQKEERLMGRRARRRPKYLAMKLRDIRNNLGNLSQGELIERLGLTGHVDRSEISAFEQGIREPDLITLKAYAYGAGISTDYLIDDDLKLPEQLPGADLTGDSRRKPQKGRPKATINTTAVLLRLVIKSDDGAARRENLTRVNIEKANLKRHGVKKLENGDYELTFSHRDEADLDEQIYALLGAITIEARRRRCSLEISAREKVTERHW